jgi:uncharacterized protein with PIN domain
MGPGAPPEEADLVRPRPREGCERFYCDEMLIRLGRWLRAAGYDTGIARRRGSDRALLETARTDRRVLITRDRKILEIRDAGASTLLLAGHGLREWVAETTEALAIDWLKAPFSRCLLCNRPLDAAPGAACARLPPRVVDMAARATWCPDCEKLYWPGSHVARMRRRLEAWQRRKFY